MSTKSSMIRVKSRRRRLRRILFWGGLFLAAGLLMVGVAWAMTGSGWFDLKSVDIAGTTYLQEDYVKSFLDSSVADGWLDKFLGPDNILAWPKTIEEESLNSLPAVTLIKIDKRYFKRAITAEVQERERLGLWCFSDTPEEKCFWFDREGVLFLPGYATEGNLTPILNDYSRPDLALGDVALEPRLFANLLKVFEAMREIDLSSLETRINDLDLQEVEVETREGPRLLFSLRFEPVGIQDALSELSKMIPLENLEYVDFRVENKVYYK